MNLFVLSGIGMSDEESEELKGSLYTLEGELEPSLESTGT